MECEVIQYVYTYVIGIYKHNTHFTHTRHMQHMHNIQHLCDQTSNKTTQSAIIGTRRHRTMYGVHYKLMNAL